jgi:hypothetical protein
VHCNYSRFSSETQTQALSPSRWEINNKFYKGAVIPTTLGIVPRQVVRRRKQGGPWSSKSSFINEEDFIDYVSPLLGGRVVLAHDGLRHIKDRNDTAELSKPEKARKTKDKALEQCWQ